MCPESETCYGYSRSELDDEPCDICKACDKLSDMYAEYPRGVELPKALGV